MEKNKISYIFSFKSGLRLDSLMQSLYRYEHLKKYSHHFNEMNMISKGERTCEIEFKIRYLVYSSRAIYRRTMIPESCLIKIEMVKFQQNSSIFPQVINSYAEYRINDEHKERVVTYCQFTTLSKAVNWLYVKIIEKKMGEFAQELKDYIKSLEK